MVANSTNISKKLFRTQKLITAGILAVLIVFLVILSVSSHEHLKNTELFKQTNEKLKSYYSDIKDNVGKPEDVLETEAQIPDQVQEKLHPGDGEGAAKQLNEEMNALIGEKEKD
ncbi:hypothetical protein PSN45_001845 [Yamadazyma tenuis]|uniref:Uncharacterized protein n=1 Tax=Candida tenuis (strain ATCC 10573 / BCRC 21748 / CBS 615 / JCM 9827 / NBRC 10315 / NRRL Y-1498 / VKM Y-70) TaxID=590646 RepID=G3BDV8_CANTC|nr:uncharacterized protein CANTEDRAFT_95841 [Yamadazyma tenuis ATCC 10573]EGV60395.1 hypothetical protein CANTEDRAFT_95841 [Yamadazyma tenuis ATCC 10573]WEJ94361.1 hypothetical protein PSN45_001845 [Yamadazyma tenuis]